MKPINASDQRSRACKAAGLCPTPRAVGFGFQHSIVQLNRSASSARVMYVMEFSSSRRSTRRTWAGLIAASTRSNMAQAWPCEDQPGQGKQLLLPKREDGRPIALSVQPTGPLLHEAQACIAERSRDLVVGDDLLRPGAEEEFPQCSRRRYGRWGREKIASRGGRNRVPVPARLDREANATASAETSSSPFELPFRLACDGLPHL
jgi:hypothetical protein